MKMNRTYCIDEDLVELMKNLNGSGLINNLLAEHFGAENSENPVIIRAKTKELIEERAIISRKIKHFKQKTIVIQGKITDELIKNKTDKQKEARKVKVNEIQRRYKNDEISEEEYWRFFEE